MKSCFKACLVTVLLFTAVLPFSAGAEQESPALKRILEEPAYPSFTYAMTDGGIQAVESPAPYRAAYLVDSQTLGVSLAEPVDMFTDGNEVYIVDRANGYIICTDTDFTVSRVIREFYYENRQMEFSAPEGVYAAGDKLYIADTGNLRIVILDKSGVCLNVINAPVSDVLPEDMVFAPVKIAADTKGRIYAVVRGVYEGIMELYEDGSFSCFAGSIPVSPDPLTRLWKSLMTKEQGQKLENFIPVEYTNLTLDQDGFIYTVSIAAEDQDAIRRLNAAGGDILGRGSPAGIPVSGVIPDRDTGAKIPGSDFVDIAGGPEGVYYALDSEYGRIFAYDSRGNLLFVFGGKSANRYGTFQKASSLILLGDRICVADSVSAGITLFERTEYAAAIMEGIRQYGADQYEESIRTWNRVLQYNSGYLLAYDMIGHARYQMGGHSEAMDYFRRAGDRAGYSKAFEQWRGNMFSRYFGWIAAGLIAAVILLMLFIRLIRRAAKKHPPVRGGIADSLRYVFYVILHPFDGFWDIKHEKRGRIWVSTLLILLTIVTLAAERSLTGFAAGGPAQSRMDIVYELQFLLVPLTLFLTANMAVTTLLDGKATLKQLYTAMGYVLAPLIIIKLPLTLVSGLMSASEAVYLQLLNAFSFIWAAFLLFGAIMNTHEYSASKTAGTLVLTTVSAVIICFICVLFFSLFSELAGFVYTLTQEIRYR